jgi:cell division protein FtsI (penicillin-binding protein 3)
LGLVLMVAVVGLGARLVVLHLGGEPAAQDKIGEIRTIRKTLLAQRGRIVDGSGATNLLALSLAVKDIGVDPRVVASNGSVAATAEKLATPLAMPAEELLAQMLDCGRRFAYLKRWVPEEDAERVRQLKLPGIVMQDNTLRFYPNKALLCHVLGFVNHEAVGSAGIEQVFDGHLKGSPGYLECAVNARRQELYDQRQLYIPPLAGAQAVLTIDLQVQSIVESALDTAMQEHRAKGAWAVVSRVRTGEVLAMASRPAYDLNDLRAATEESRLNRAIGFCYEPGSAFKAVVASAALNEGMVTPSTVFDCENGAWVHCGKVLKDDGHRYGRLTFAEGMKKSSNIMMAKVGVGLGNENFYRYLKAFRLGERTGIELPGEERGISHPAAKWSGISASRIAIGQGISVTALQMIGVYGAIANDGYLMRPWVVREIRAADGTVLQRGEPQVLGRPIRAETSAVMRRILAGVTEEGGTGKRAAVEGYSVAGKTGTAQKPDPVRGGYSDTAFVATFVGFLPSLDPEIVMIVVVDEPQPCHYAGVVAAPVFARIAEQTIRYLEIRPDGRQLAGPASVADLIGR